MKILIGKRVHEGDYVYVENCLKMAKLKYQNENTNAIYATEKGDTIQMLRETYPDSIQLMKAAKEYEGNGFKCYYTTRKGDI